MFTTTGYLNLVEQEREVQHIKELIYWTCVLRWYRGIEARFTGWCDG